MSGDAEAGYFGDGLADELIHLLSQVRGMLVVGRSSSFEFKGKNESVREIGEQLNVSTVLGGSVRRMGNKLRITAQLTDTKEGFNLWSRRYDRETKDLFAIQEDIALSIVSMLKVNLKGDATPPRSRYAGNVEAHSLYLKGRFYWDQRTSDGIKKAGECFQHAIAVDPRCAPAYAGLADFYISLGFWGVMSPPGAWSLGRDFALKSLQIDSRLPEAEISLAKHALFADWDWTSAEQRLLRAIEMEPSLSIGHFSYAILLIQLGRFESALLEFRCARELDPLSLTVTTGVAWAYYYAGKFDQATEECLKTFSLRADYFEALGCMGLIAIGEGRLEDAVSWFERGVAVEPIPLGRGFLGYSYALSGRNEDARAILSALEAAATTRYVTPIAPALIHIGLGEWDDALTSFEKAWKLREAFLAYLKVFPPFKPLHGLPRYRALLNEIASATASEYLTI
jgi:serine/threonine-protein kinase